jgi:YHS domain-containing protein
VRLLPFLFVLVALAVILWPYVRRRRRVATPEVFEEPALDLVKDPVCRKYVVRSRAVHTAPEAPYFCSTACAERWAAGPLGG